MLSRVGALVRCCLQFKSMTCAKYLTLIPSAGCTLLMCKIALRKIVTDDGRTRRQENLEALTDCELTISSQNCFILHGYTQITIRHALNNSVLHAAASVKDLGVVTIDKDLQFDINNNTHRAHYRICPNSKCFVSPDRCTLLCACTAYIRPRWNAHVFLPCSNLIKFNALHFHAACFLRVLYFMLFVFKLVIVRKHVWWIENKINK